MIFYFNSKGEPLSMIHERVFQGSNRASSVYFTCPTAKENVVDVAFTMPDGSFLPRNLMTLVSADGLEGVYDENGACFNLWKYDLPSSVTAQFGAVTMQFFITAQNGEVSSTASVQFYVERGVTIVELEHGDSYQDLLNAMLALKNKADLTAEDLYKFLETAAPELKVDKTTIANALYGTDEHGNQKTYSINEYSNKINVDEQIQNVSVSISPNNEYYYGELTSLNIALNDGEKAGQTFYLTYKSGDTATTFSIAGNYLSLDSIVSAPNTVSEISGVWDGSAWLIAWRHL